MSNFFVLLKYTIINNFGFNKFNKKKDHNLLYFIPLLYLLILAIITFYMFIYLESFMIMGDAYGFIKFITIICVFSTFFSNITKSNTYIFKTKDYETLITLPIKNVEIVSVKLISLYLFNFLITSSIIIATNIAFVLVVGVDIILILMSLACLLFIPLIPMAVTGIIAFLLGFIPIPKKIKNVVVLIGYVLFFALIMILSWSMSTENNLFSVVAGITDKIIIFKWLNDALISENLLSYLYYVLTSIASISIFILIAAKCYQFANSHLVNTEGKVKQKITDKDYMSRSSIASIMIKDFKVITSSPSMVMNLFSGSIMLIIAFVAIIINSASIKEFTVLGPGFIEIGFFYGFLLCSTMVSTTTSGISLEGKSFWIIKSSPITEKEVIKAKCLMNLCLFCIPFALLYLIAIIIVGANIIIGLMLLVSGVLLIFANTYFGLLLNILSPKFDYDNPLKVVKQGKPVMIAILTSILFEAIIGLLAIFAIILLGLNPYIVGGIVLSIAIGLFILMYKLLHTIGIKRLSILEI